MIPYSRVKIIKIQVLIKPNIWQFNKFVISNVQNVFLDQTRRVIRLVNYFKASFFNKIGYYLKKVKKFVFLIQEKLKLEKKHIDASIIYESYLNVRVFKVFY